VADAEQTKNIAGIGVISHRRGDVTRDMRGAKYSRYSNALRHTTAASNIAMQGPVFSAPV